MNLFDKKHAWILGGFEFLQVDNVIANAGSGGSTFATDDIGGVHYPRSKQTFGVDGTATDVSASNPLPVVQTGASALPTGAATAAKQPALGTAGTASADVITVQGIAAMTPLLVNGSANAQPVTDNGGSLTIDSPQLAATLGQKAMTASNAVVIASDQSSIPVAATLTAETTKVIGTVNIAAAQSVQAVGNVAAGAADSGNPVKVGGKYNTTPPTLTNGQRGDIQLSARGEISTYSPDSTGTGTISAADAVVAAPGGAGATVSGASTAGSLVALACAGGDSSWIMQLSGTLGGSTFYFEGSLDSTTGTDGTWINILGRQTGVTNTVLAGSTTTASVFRGNTSGWTWIRMRAVGGAAINAAVRIEISSGTGAIFLNASIPAGSNEIGGVNLTKLNGTATDTNSGVKSAGTLRVVLATDQPALTTPMPVSGTVTANAGTGPFPVAGTVASAAADSGNPVKIGGKYNSTPPTFTDGQRGDAQLDANGYLKVNVAAGGASGGTSSTFGAAIPGTGTAAGFSDGTNMQLGRVFDADSGAGTQYVAGVNLRISASGGSVEGGTAANPLRTDPTGTTTQPVSGTVTITPSGTQTVAGAKTNNGAVPGATNVGVLPAVANAAAPTQTEANQVALRTTLSGDLAITMDGEAVVLGAGAATIGALTANQSVNVAQMNGVATTMGNGISGTGVQRVTIASDSTGQIALAAGSATIGALTANQSINNAQINGVTPLMGNGVTGTGSQRVTIASDNTAFNITDIPATTGGYTISRLLSAATTNATNAKASAGQVFGWYLYNANAAVRYVKFYNKATAPTVGTDTPVMTIPVPAGSAANVEFGKGIAFATGISYATTTGVTDADTAAVAANEIIINLLYK